MQRWLIGLGLLLIAAGLLWPWISRIPWFRLPGDVVIEREGFSFYFPVTTSILISLILSILFWLMRR